MTKCPQCQSERVRKGMILNPLNGHPVQFRPDDPGLFALTLNYGPELQPKAHACLDCGLVWGKTDKAELNAFVRKHCN